MDEQFVRALAAVQLTNTDVAASLRALEKVALALLALHPHRKEVISLTEHFLRNDGILQRKEPDGKYFLSAYLRHGERLLAEMRDIQANA